MDQQAITRARVEDDASAQITRIRDAWQLLKEALAETEPQAESTSQALTELEQKTESTEHATSALADAYNDLKEGTADAASETSSYSSSLGEARSALSDNTAAASDNAAAVTAQGNAAQQAGEQNKQAADKAKELKQANFDLTDALDGATGGLDGMLGMLGRVAPAAGAAVVAVKTVISVQHELAQAFTDEEVGVVRLNSVLRANIANYQQYLPVIERVTLAAQALGFSDDEVRDTLSRLIPITGSMTQSLRILAVAQDVARYSNHSLEDSAKALAIAMETGTTRGLREYGIILKTGADATTILEQAQRQAAGAAQDYGNTVEAAMERARIAQENFYEESGQGAAQFEADMARTQAAMYEQGGATGFLADVYTRLGGVFDVFAPQVRGAMAGVGQSIEDAQNQMADSGDAMGESAEDTAQRIADAADEGGSLWEKYLAEHLDEANTTTKKQTDLFKGILDLAEATTVLGRRAGGGFNNGIAAAMADARAAIQQEASADIGILNGVIQAINQMRASVGLAALELMQAQQVAVSAAAEDKRESNRTKTIEQDFDRRHGRSSIDTIGSPSGYAAYAEASRVAHTEQGSKAASEEVKEAEERARKEAEAAAKRAAGGSGKKGGGGKGGSGGRNSGDIAEDLADAQAEYNQKKEELDLERKLADAREEVKDRTAEAKTHSQGYAGLQEFIADAINGATKAEEQATAKVREELAGREAAYQEMRDQAVSDLHDIALEEYKQQGILKELQREAADALKPLEETARKAAKAVSDLSDEAARSREEFQDLKDAQDDLMLQWEEQAKQILGPMDEALAAHEARIAEMREGVEELAASYDKKLLPKEKELAELTRAQARDDRAKELDEYNLRVTNLAAQLANATKGTAEYAAIEKELEEARKQAERKDKEIGLTNSIEEIRAEKEEAVRAAEERIRKEEQRLAQEKQARAEKAAELEKQKALIEEEQKAIARREELYNREMRDRQAAAKQAQEDADDAVKKEQERQAERQKATKERLEQLEAERREVQHNAQEAEYAATREINATKKKIAELEKPYEDQKKWLQDQAEAVRDLAKDQKDKDDDEIEQAKGKQERAQDELNAFRDRNKENEIEANWAEAKKKATEDTKKLIEETIPKQEAATKSVQSSATATRDLAKALDIDLKGALQNMAGATDTDLDAVLAVWLDTFGVTVETGKIWKALFAKDNTGFHHSLDAMTHLKLGTAGYRGVWLQEMDTLSLEVENKLLNEEKPVLVAAVGNVAKAMADELKAVLDTELKGFTLHIGVDYSSDGGGGGGGDEPPQRAMGGDVRAGRTYWVHKDEMFVPGMDGMIVPRGAADGFAMGLAAAGGNKGGGTTIVITNENHIAPTFVVQGGDLMKYGHISRWWDQFAGPMAESLKRNQVGKGITEF